MTPEELASYKTTLRAALVKEFPQYAGRIWIRAHDWWVTVTVRKVLVIGTYGERDAEGDAQAVADELRDYLRLKEPLK